MKTTVWLCLAAFAATSLAAAESDAPGAVKAAAKQLADKANYSWISTSKPESDGQGPTMTVDGKAAKGAFTQLVIGFGDTSTDVVLKAGKVAVKREGEWKTPDELEGGGAWMARRMETFKAPAQEAEDLAAKAKDLKSGEGGVYSSDLTEAGVKEMFGRWRRSAQTPEAKDAKGWVKFWLKDGALIKYQFNMQGKVSVGQDGTDLDVNRTSTVEIKDVGSTKVEVPEEAKKKFSGA